MALAAAFVVAPRFMAGIGPGSGFAGERDLAEALRTSFTGYWSSGDRELSPGLEGVVDYWFRYHLAKAAIAALLLVVLVALGVRVWKAFVKAEGRGTGRSVALASTGVVLTMLALFSLVAVMANLQGMVAPYASLLPMLTADASDAQLTGTLDQIRRQLADSPGADGHTTPALQLMIDDFARYHVAMAVIAAIVAAALIALSATLWRRFARTERSSRRARRVLGSFGVLSALLALTGIVVAVANTTTAADPSPALLAFFQDSW
ncbi:hypothetical protein [Actinomadura sp. KC06]|uniref:hypothetical protein n=1 Tax=Actinomadura sp. KC06 TaxID=2530369 RepID=UPI001A9E6713|nr:hypothetical protein [Actinomadura sp. KC06]